MALICVRITVRNRLTLPRAKLNYIVVHTPNKWQSFCRSFWFFITSSLLQPFGVVHHYGFSSVRYNPFRFVPMLLSILVEHRMDGNYFKKFPIPMKLVYRLWHTFRFKRNRKKKNTKKVWTKLKRRCCERLTAHRVPLTLFCAQLPHFKWPSLHRQIVMHEWNERAVGFFLFFALIVVWSGGVYVHSLIVYKTLLMTLYCTISAQSSIATHWFERRARRAA